VAVLAAAPGVLNSAQRTAFLTANNGAFFALCALHFAGHRPDAFWMFSLGFGAVLLGIAMTLTRRQEEDTMFSGAYLLQGFLAITLGLVMKVTGPALALVLGVESAVLLAGLGFRHRTLREIVAFLCALGAFGLALSEMHEGSRSPVALGLGVSGLLLFDAWLAKFLRGEWPARLFSIQSLAFALLGLTLVGATVWHETPVSWQPATFALVALAGLVATRIRLFEVTLTAQLFAVIAANLVCVRCVESAPSPWWSPMPVLLALLILMHAWQRMNVESWKAASRVVQFVFAGLSVIVASCWLRAFHHDDAWLVATSALGLATFGYALATRAWPMAIVGQASFVTAALAFVGGLSDGHPHWAAAISPCVAFLAMGILFPPLVPIRWPEFASAAISFEVMGTVYRAVAAVLFAGWGLEYIPREFQVANFALVGAAQILVGSFRHSRERSIAGALYGAFGMLLFCFNRSPQASMLDLIAILSVPASLRWVEHFFGHETWPSSARQAIVGAGLLSVWLWATVWANNYGGQVTATWAFLALFVFLAGLALRDRVYRLGAFAILGAALLRLFTLDVWRLDTLYRIVSFLVLGAVLLILSFVYNRFAETFRRWL
jgi:hypothetical protein